MEKMEGDPVMEEDWKGELFKLKEVIVGLCRRQEEAQGRAGQAGWWRNIPQALGSEYDGCEWS